ncbi:MAG: 2-oxoacid:acceptor oxidoreductase family protein [Gammaproteobacteria bacterium]
MSTVSIAVVGSGGAGALTTGNLLLEASARAGCYGVLTRSVGPQIRGGEAAAMLRLGAEPVAGNSDEFDILLALDWNNADRFAAELPLGPGSVIIADPGEGEIPEAIAKSTAQVCELPIAALAKKVKKGRANLIALGAVAEIIGMEQQPLSTVLEEKLAGKGEQVLQTSMETVDLGRQAAAGFEKRPLPVREGNGADRWIITGNQAAGYGAVKGGIRFVAAYPITPGKGAGVI